MPDIGFEISGTGITTATIRPDNTLTRSSKPSTRVVKFGNGYEQRGRAGINNIEETYSITMSNREKATADDIVKFLDNTFGVTSFDFTVPDSNSDTNVSTIKVVCDDYAINYGNGNYYDVNASFRRVYGV